VWVLVVVDEVVVMVVVNVVVDVVCVVCDCRVGVVVVVLCQMDVVRMAWRFARQLGGGNPRVVDNRQYCARSLPSPDGSPFARLRTKGFISAHVQCSAVTQRNEVQTHDAVLQGLPDA